MKQGWSFVKMWRPISALASASLQTSFGEVREDRAAKPVGWRRQRTVLPYTIAA
jgi:hypothetical protein